jgi:hypothetical protein
MSLMPSVTGLPYGFPGAKVQPTADGWRAYRGIVIGTGAHTLVVRRMLRGIRDRAEDRP